MREERRWRKRGKRGGKERNGEMVRVDEGEGGRSRCDHVQLHALRTDGTGGGVTEFLQHLGQSRAGLD